MTSDLPARFHLSNPTIVGVSAILLLGACTTAPLTEGGLLTSYADLRPSNGILTKTKLRVDKSALLAAKSVSIMPTVISVRTQPEGVTVGQLRLVANAIDRSLCARLSARFTIVEPGEPADLNVHAQITHLAATDKTAAGVSNVVSIGGTVASVATGVPVPPIRLPLGLGGLSVEAQALNARQMSVAAMTWARGADSFTTKARVSEEGDAYALAKEFAADFAKLLVTGDDPIQDMTPPLPSAQAVSEFFGAKPKYAACARFGSNPGVGDVIGGAIGLPPDWTDKGPQTPQ